LEKPLAWSFARTEAHPLFRSNYRDDDWSSRAVSRHDAVSIAKKRAERIYPGSSASWMEAHFTEEDVTRYLAGVFGDLRCSFCGKRPEETLTATFEGDGNAWIRATCIAEFHEELNPRPKLRD